MLYEISIGTIKLTPTRAKTQIRGKVMRGWKLMAKAVTRRENEMKHDEYILYCTGYKSDW